MASQEAAEWLTLEDCLDACIAFTPENAPSPGQGRSRRWNGPATGSLTGAELHPGDSSAGESLPCLPALVLPVRVSSASLPKSRIEAVDSVVDVAVDTPGHCGNWRGPRCGQDRGSS